jgi:hypothetical protein
MTREDARSSACVALERALKQRGGSQAEEDCIADAILAAEAEEREKWIRLAPWWTGRALQSPEDIRRLAVAEERDRCTKIVDAGTRLGAAGPPLAYVAAQQFATELAKDIADGIRQGLPAPDTAAERDRENAWLRRLLTWCAARLRYDCYRESLARYIAAGPTDPDATRIVNSDRQPAPEKADG